MKSTLSLVLAAALALSGCSIFQRSPTWDSVVSSRSEYSGSGAMDAKDGYLNHLHQVLRGAGVAHKIVTYQMHVHTVYREEGIQAATAILYRDEATPLNPWWIMDEYHHVPVWLPSWTLDAQLEFFTQCPVDVVSVKDFAGEAAPERHVTKVAHPPRHSIAHTSREKKFRLLFTGGHTPAKPAPAKPAPADADPLTTNVLSGHSASSGAAPDSRAEAVFRSAHGTQFDPGSSTDRSKMNELRRQLLNRTQRVSLRTQ